MEESSRMTVHECVKPPPLPAETNIEIYVYNNIFKYI
jgi:hypothetical protein